MDFSKTYDLNPFVSGAITCAFYLTATYFLPKKISGATRTVLSIGIAIAGSLLLQLILDILFGK